MRLQGRWLPAQPITILVHLVELLHNNNNNLVDMVVPLKVRVVMVARLQVEVLKDSADRRQAHLMVDHRRLQLMADPLADLVDLLPIPIKAARLGSSEMHRLAPQWRRINKARWHLLVGRRR